MRMKSVVIGAVLAAMLVAGSAWAEDIYNAGDLVALRSIKSDNPGLLAGMNLDAPTTDEFVVTADTTKFFPPSVEIGDVMKVWIRDGATFAVDDDEYSEDLVGWIQDGGEWRVMYLRVTGENLTSFNASKLSSLPHLSNIVFNNNHNITSVELPKLDNLYFLEIYGNSVTNVDVSKLTNLTVFGLNQTGVTVLTLPPSLNLAYFKCTRNNALIELSGFYAKETELKPFEFIGNDSIFYNSNSALQQHSVTISPSENGTVTKNGGDKIYNGDSVTFTVKANPGYKLDTFRIDGNSVTVTGGTYTHKATGDVTAAATFIGDSGESDDPDALPSAPDNTEVSIPANHDGNVVSISVTKDGSSIPANVSFKVWLLVAQNKQSQGVSARAADPGYFGPFIAVSRQGALDIDVNNLKNADGTKASIKAGTYIVKFADTEGKYIGTTEPIALNGTGAVAPPNSNDGKDSGGGCNAGYGLFGLLLMSLAALKRRA
jgi:hypothetical protein